MSTNTFKMRWTGSGSVSGSVIDSFRLEIAIASTELASLFRSSINSIITVSQSVQFTSVCSYLKPDAELGVVCLIVCKPPTPLNISYIFGSVD